MLRISHCNFVLYISMCNYKLIGPDAKAWNWPGPFRGQVPIKVHFDIPTKKKEKKKRDSSISEPAVIGLGLCLIQTPFLNINIYLPPPLPENWSRHICCNSPSKLNCHVSWKKKKSIAFKQNIKSDHYL